MISHKIAVMPGDGIGPEVIREGMKICNYFQEIGRLNMDLIHFPQSANHFLKTGETLSDESFDALSKVDAIYFGAIGDPRIKDANYARDILLRLRFDLDLYANIRPAKLLNAKLSPLKNQTAVDLMVVRENTEGVYVKVGGIFKKGTPDEIALQEEVNTRKGVERILHVAFREARKKQKPLVMADKHNAMSYGHDLWHRAFLELKTEYSDVDARHLYVDILAMKLITEPESLGIIVTNNLFGDILADEAAGLIGGMGFAASGNINPDTRHALFEPVHGSAPDIVGQNKANPIAAILSLAMMLEYLGYSDLNAQVEQAVVQVLQEGLLPVELGGHSSTSDIGDSILDALKQ